MRGRPDAGADRGTRSAPRPEGVKEVADGSVERRICFTAERSQRGELLRPEQNEEVDGSVVRCVAQSVKAESRYRLIMVGKASVPALTRAIRTSRTLRIVGSYGGCASSSCLFNTLASASVSPSPR